MTQTMSAARWRRLVVGALAWLALGLTVGGCEEDESMCFYLCVDQVTQPNDDPKPFGGHVGHQGAVTDFECGLRAESQCRTLVDAKLAAHIAEGAISEDAQTFTFVCLRKWVEGCMDPVSCAPVWHAEATADPEISHWDLCWEWQNGPPPTDGG